MAEYLVLDANPGSLLIALLDAHGHHHVARVTNHVPAVGASLHGNRAAPGFLLMVDHQNGALYRCIFEATDCGLQGTMQRLHPGSRTPSTSPGTQASA